MSTCRTHKNYIDYKSLPTPGLTAADVKQVFYGLMYGAPRPHLVESSRGTANLHVIAQWFWDNRCDCMKDREWAALLARCYPEWIILNAIHIGQHSRLLKLEFIYKDKDPSIRIIRGGYGTSL